MVWVWPDPSTCAMAESVPLPIPPLLEQFVKDYPNTCFMRDLPYGLELLGENLLDISHLPFSHHSVGGFYRQDARPLHLRTLSEKERLVLAQEEHQWQSSCGGRRPRQLSGSLVSSRGSKRLAIGSYPDGTQSQTSRGGQLHGGVGLLRTLSHSIPSPVWRTTQR